MLGGSRNLRTMKTTNITQNVLTLPSAIIGAIFFSFATMDAATLNISATANIFGSGHTTPPSPAGQGGGILPSVIAFPAGVDRVLTFSDVTGMIDFGGGAGPHGPDGFASGDYEVFSYGGISGFHASRSACLVGVFLEDSEPTNPAPLTLDFTTSALGAGFTNLSPQIAQTFFIGDGLTGTGSGAVQQFFAPATATRLFLGFVDGVATNMYPGGYSNNIGSLTATFSIALTSCPTSAIRLSQVEISWPSQSGIAYQVQYRSDLTTNVWLDLLGTNVIGNGMTEYIYDPILPGQPQRFYRVNCQSSEIVP